MSNPIDEIAAAIYGTIHALAQNFPEGTAFVVTIAKFEGEQMHAMTGTNAKPELAQTLLETALSTVDKVSSMNNDVETALRTSQNPSLN